MAGSHTSLTDRYLLRREAEIAHERYKLFTTKTDNGLPRFHGIRAGSSLEKRRDARYPTNDSALIQVLPASGPPIMSATVVDISKSGLRLETQTIIAKGTRIEVMITKPRILVVVGEVRYCRRAGELFHVGVLIENLVLMPADVHQHVDEDQAVLYLAGESPISPELVRLQQHLTTCDECGSTLEVIRRDMSASRRRFSPPVRWPPAQ